MIGARTIFQSKPIILIHTTKILKHKLKHKTIYLCKLYLTVWQSIRKDEELVVAYFKRLKQISYEEVRKTMTYLMAVVAKDLNGEPTK